VHFCRARWACSRHWSFVCGIALSLKLVDCSAPEFDFPEDGGATDDGSGGTSNTGGESSSDAGIASGGAPMNVGGSAGFAGTGGFVDAGLGGRLGDGGTVATGGMAGTSNGGLGGAATTGGVGGASDAGSPGAGGLGGSAGSGGTTNPECGDNPAPEKSRWSARASHSSLDTEQPFLYNPPSNAIDGDPTERWSTGKLQAGEEWFEINFSQPVTIDQVTLVVNSGDVQDYPRQYEVRLSNAAGDFGAPLISSGTGQPVTTTWIDFAAPATGRYLLISQTGTADSWWSIAELEVSCAGQ
jgi:hypothetical protein